MCYQVLPGAGVGWLVRKYGLTCDNVLSFEIVTADGRSRLASASENEDLFWALRGGGGNFGGLTSFEFRAHPVSTVLGGLIIYSRDRAADVLRFYRDCTVGTIGIAKSPNSRCSSSPLNPKSPPSRQTAGRASRLSGIGATALLASKHRHRRQTRLALLDSKPGSFFD